MKTTLTVTLSLCALLACSTVTQAGDVSAGKEKSAKCAGCHGTDGKGKDPNPPVSGLEESYIVKQLQDYKSGAREYAMMKMMTQGLSNDDMVNLGAYYASLPK